MENRPSAQELTRTELLLNQSLEQNDQEKTQSFSNSFESFQAAKQGLLTTLSEGVRGEGYSSEETVAHAELLLKETARNYGLAAADPGEDTSYSLGGILMHDSLRQFKDLAKSHETSLGISVQEPKVIAETLEEELEDIDPEDVAKHLEAIYGSIHQDIVGALLSQAAQNQNDIKRLRRLLIKTRAIEALKSGAKITLGAVATAAAIRLMSQE